MSGRKALFLVHSLLTRHFEVMHVHMLYRLRCSTKLAEILCSVHHLHLVGEFINGKEGRIEN